MILDLRNEKCELAKQCLRSQQDIKKLTDQCGELELFNRSLISETEQFKLQIKEMKTIIDKNNVADLKMAKTILKFRELESYSKPLTQLDNGSIVFYNNERTSELFNMSNGIRKNVTLTTLDKKSECSFVRTIGKCVYFTTAREKNTHFYRVSFEDSPIFCKQINAMDTSEFSLLKSQPLYFLERGKEWIIYKYHEKYTEMRGETFDISEIGSLSQHEPHYHKCVLYLFRYHSEANLTKVNEKVVTVEGPLLDLDECSFYSTHRSDFIYILNSTLNIILLLDTTNLAVTQLPYELPAGSIHHWIVGINDGTLTMALEMKSCEGTSEFFLTRTQIEF